MSRAPAATYPKKPHIIGEYFGSRHVQRHVLWFPDFRDPGAYRQGISFEGFARRMLKRPNKHNTRWFYVRHFLDDWLLTVESHARFVQELPEYVDEPNMGSEVMPTVEHHDLLSFYEKIGYDRAKNKLSPDLREYEGSQLRHPIFHDLVARARERT